MSVDVFERMGMDERFGLLPQTMRGEYLEFIAYLMEIRHMAPTTVQRIGKVSLRYCHWLRVRRGYDSVYESSSQDVVDHLLETPQIRRETWRKHKQNLAHVLHWMLYKDKIVPSEIERLKLIGMPAKNYRKKEPTKPFTNAEIKALFDAINDKYPYDAKAVDRLNRGIKVGGNTMRSLRLSMQRVQVTTLALLLLETGFRVSEAQNVRLADVDIVNKTVPTTGKGSRFRAVPYTDVLRNQMKIWTAHRELVATDHDHVWIAVWSNLGQALSPSGLDKVFNFMDGDYRYHRFRKTFATRSYAAGMGLLTVQMMLGHSDIKTTSIYLGLNEAEMLEDSAAFEDLRSESYRDLLPNTAV